MSSAEPINQKTVPVGDLEDVLKEIRQQKWKHAHPSDHCLVCGHDHDCLVADVGWVICRRIGRHENGHSLIRSSQWEFKASFQVGDGGMAHVWKFRPPIRSDNEELARVGAQQRTVAEKFAQRLDTLHRAAASAWDDMYQELFGADKQLVFNREKLTDVLRGLQSDIEALNQYIGEHRGLSIFESGSKAERNTP